jgi:hypothetical protein
MVRNVSTAIRTIRSFVPVAVIKLSAVKDSFVSPGTPMRRS